MKIVSISDTHGARGHSKLIIPECDVLIHAGDIGGRTNCMELVEFLAWFERQPAKVKIFIAGNHDLVLDRKWRDRQQHKGSIEAMLARKYYQEARELLEQYKIKYLEDKEYVYEGVKFYGSPYSPSFHREHWAFNADRGDEIKKVWSKIPSDVNVLITHTPVYKVLDLVPERYKQFPGEDMNVGCSDLFQVMKDRLFNLKLHVSGHIHDQNGVILHSVSNTRHVLFQNASVLTNDYTQLVTNPLIITI